MAADFSDELNQGDCFTLKRAAEGSDSPWPPDAEGRYSFYRRRGHCKADAIAYAVAWARNSVEQAARRRPNESECLGDEVPF